MRRNETTRSVFALGVLIFIAAFIFSGPVQGADISIPDFSKTGPHFIGQSEKHDISPPLRSITPRRPTVQGGLKIVPLLRSQTPVSKKYKYDPAVQSFFKLEGASYPEAPMALPALSRNFEGNNNDGNRSITGFRYLPSDANGDVGLNHYVQWVNTIFSIYDKSGAIVYGPAAGNTLWTGFGGACETNNDGDPVVLYDRQADRWLMSQFAVPGPYYQCIAVSQTGDPTGSWYRYAFLYSDAIFNDYPKFGIWNDGYYMTVNQFDSSDNFVGAGAVAFERSRMLQGLEAQQVYFNLHSIDSSLGNMLPSHSNGPNVPPAGSPNYVVKFDDTGRGAPADQLEIWAFHVDWTTPANSTFAKIATLATAAFDSIMCINDVPNCIPQPDISDRVAAPKVDAISDRLMNRLQYRNSGSYESMVVNHTVDVGSSHAGIRWYELRNSGSGWDILQRGTYAPDSDHRWMGSAAMDGMGNIAVGYSVSGTATFPSIRYTGRLSTDTVNTLPQGEATIITGGGSQTDSSGRWGDYSSMSIDPTDDSTFWYTQQYYSSTSNIGWQTRIAAFKLCSNNAARTTGPIYATTLQEAYGNAASSDTIFAQSVTFRENLNLNADKSITLRGGYNCSYESNPLKTTIVGSLTISGGTLIVENVLIQ